MGAQARDLFLSILIFAQLMDAMLHRTADSRWEGLQYKPFVVAGGSSAAKGGGRCSGTQRQQVASCLGVMEPAGLSISPSSCGADATTA